MHVDISIRSAVCTHLDLEKMLYIYSVVGNLRHIDALGLPVTFDGWPLDFQSRHRMYTSPIHDGEQRLVVYEALETSVCLITDLVPVAHVHPMALSFNAEEVRMWRDE